jgi:thiopurine S-methyltransferase
MHHDQWLDRWKQNRIGFHESTVNPHLRRYLPDFNLNPGDTIFMPLCGKAHDIDWIAQQGFQVVGIELSEIAIESCFYEKKNQKHQIENQRIKIRKKRKKNQNNGVYFFFEQEKL